MRILRDNLEINRYGKWEASDQQYYANKLYGGSPDSAKAIAFSPLNMSGTEKYITTVISLLGEDYKPLLNACAGLKKAKSTEIERLLKTIKAKFCKFGSYNNEHKAIKLVYLTL